MAPDLRDSITVNRSAMAIFESGEGFAPPGSTLPDYEDSEKDNIERAEMNNASAVPPTETLVEIRTCCKIGRENCLHYSN